MESDGSDEDAVGVIIGIGISDFVGCIVGRSVVASCSFITVSVSIVDVSAVCPLLQAVSPSVSRINPREGTILCPGLISMAC